MEAAGLLVPSRGMPKGVGDWECVAAVIRKIELAMRRIRLGILVRCRLRFLDNFNRLIVRGGDNRSANE